MLLVFVLFLFFSFFFFNDTATTEIYTLSLHDALPISTHSQVCVFDTIGWLAQNEFQDRKTTRLNSSHTVISYAVFCLKKKKKNTRLNSNHRQKTNADNCYKNKKHK